MLCPRIYLSTSSNVEVDYMFKLEPRAKIPAFTPYLIVLPKTEELRKQSKKLLHVVTLAHQRHSLVH